MATLGPRHLVTSAVLIVPMLLLAGCGDAAPVIQSAPLAGPSAGLGPFEGRWFDLKGHLIVVVDDRPEIGIGLPPYPAVPLRLEDARLQGDHILLRARSEVFEGPLFGYLKLAGKDRLVMGQAVSPSHQPPQCSCLASDFMLLPQTVLIRDPSPAWVLRKSARRNIQSARRSYQRGRDAVFERLARIL